MNWLIYVFVSIFFFTCMQLYQRKLAIDVENPRAMAVLYNGAAVIISVFIFLINGSFSKISLPTAKEAWIFMAIACICYGTYERFRFVAAKLIDASSMAIIANLSVLVSFVGSLFLYSENLAISKLVGSCLIILSVILVSVDKKKKKISSKGILVVVGIHIIIGLAMMLDKKGAMFFNPMTYNIFVWTAPILFVYFPQIKFNVMKKEFKKFSWRLFILAGLNVIAFIFGLKAYEVAEATKVIPLSQLSILLTVILGVILLKERDNIVKKVIAGIIGIAGVYFLV